MTVHRIPGRAPALRVLSGNLATQEMRTAAADLLMAAGEHGEATRLPTDAELAAMFPHKADRFPRIYGDTPPRFPPSGDDEGRGYGGAIVVLAGCIAALIIIADGNFAGWW